MYTTSHALLDALTACGVTHIFANFGSDHPTLIEAIAEARAAARPVPRIITSPHEMVAMSAAHGFYRWWELDITYLTLRALHSVGLVSDLIPRRRQPS